MSIATGLGYDCHRLVEGRPLIIGGVEIPHTHGLDGHSDADVLTHAIIDALLGAAALGDIGQHFPDTDERYRGADSIELLQRPSLCSPSAAARSSTSTRRLCWNSRSWFRIAKRSIVASLRRWGSQALS